MTRMPPPPRRLSLRPEAPPRGMKRRIVRAIMAMTVSPNSRPMSRVLSRMSPFSTWLNSCATTPCSSSRSRFTSAPRVTAIAALAGL